MSDEDTKITISAANDEADSKSRKKQSGLYVRPVAATSSTQGDAEEDEEDESITPRRRRSSKDRRNKKKRKSTGKKKDDVTGSDNESKDDVRATLTALANEVEDHRAQIAKLEQRITEIAQSNGIDPSEFLRSKKDVKETPPKYDDVTNPDEKGGDDSSEKDDVKFAEDSEKTNSGDDEKEEEEEENNNNNNNNNQQTSIYKAQKISKLERLTGRRESLSKIQPFLMAETPDEAMKNAQMLWSSDHLKRMYGSRPVFSDKPEKEQPSSSKRRGHRASKSSSSAALAQNALASKHTPRGSEIPTSANLEILKREAAAAKSKKKIPESNSSSVTSSITSSMTSPLGNMADVNSPSAAAISSPTSAAAAAGRRRSSSCGSNSDGSCEPAAGLVINRKVDKLNKLTGRRDSISEIVELLDPKTPDEARECAKSLYTMEALKKKLGARPTRPVSMAVVLPHAAGGKKENGEDCECEECKKRGENNGENSESSSTSSSESGSSSESSEKYNSESTAMGTSCGSDSPTTLNDGESKQVGKSK